MPWIEAAETPAAKAAGYTVDMNPTPNSVAVWTNAYTGLGHVAYVENVISGTTAATTNVFITESNYVDYLDFAAVNDPNNAADLRALVPHWGGGYDGPVETFTETQMQTHNYYQYTLDGYIHLPASANLGVFSAGYWYRDMNGDNQWTSADGNPVAFGPAGATPVVGDWDGSGKTELGYYLNGTWYLDAASGVETFSFGFTGSNVFPVVGDWNGDGKTEVGVYCNGAWFRDVDGSHTWDATNQADLAYLGWNDNGTNTVIPVPGNWAGDGKTEMGVYCNGVWFLDSTGSGKWDGTHSYWGWSNSQLVPVVGNWSDSGLKDQFAVYNQGVWFRDADGTHTWDAANQAATAYFGWAGRSRWWATGPAPLVRRSASRRAAVPCRPSVSRRSSRALHPRPPRTGSAPRRGSSR